MGAPEEMNGDRDLCMAAVTQNGMQLKDVPEEMKGDRELCMAAVAQDGHAIQFIGAPLLDDVDIVVTAMQSYRRKHPIESGRDIVQFGEKDIYGVWMQLSQDMKSNKAVRKATGL